MPLSKDAEWDYTYSAKMLTGVESVRVINESSIDGHPAYNLSGPMGRSRIAWIGDKLVAAELSGTRFFPPITLLAPGRKGELPTWQGSISSGGTSSPASAQISQESSTFSLGGRKYSATVVVHRITYGSSNLEVSTTYADGLGIAQQVSRRNGQFVSSLEYLKGP